MYVSPLTSADRTDRGVKSLADLINLMLSLPRIADSYLTRAAFDILELIFAPASHAHTSTNIQTSLSELLALRPAPSAHVVLPGWLGALEHAFATLARVDPTACKSALYSNFEGVLSLCATEIDSIEVRTRAEKTARGMIRWCLELSATDVQNAISLVQADASNSKKQKKSESSTRAENPLAGIVLLLDDALTNLKWRGLGTPHILAICTALLSALRVRPVVGAGASSDPRRPPAASLLLSSHVVKIGSFRSTPTFDYKEAADIAIGMAIEVCGPQWVVSLLPLDLLQDNNKRSAGRAWLLPLLRTKITNTALKHFVDTFVPLSATLFQKKSEALAKPSGGEIEAKIYEALVDQIWALFPGYCDLPIDLIAVR